MGSIKFLSDFERKLITIIQHNNKRGKSPSLEELEMRTGHNSNEIKETIKGLVEKRWIEIQDRKLVVIQKLF